ncbi:MAG TPA: threonine synthase [Bacilli bacterium]
MGRFWLECVACNKFIPIEELRGVCACGGTLLVRYDLDWAKRLFTKESIAEYATDMWRYRKLMPLRDETSIVSLGEGFTPLIRMRNIPQGMPLKNVWVKREDLNPTGSFKARGMSAALTLLKENGLKKAAVGSNGNAASALAAYAARAEIAAFVFIPKDCPAFIIEECLHYGADVCLVDGYIHDASRIVADGQQEQGWFNVGTLKEPGRVEGKKTMGLELAEQFGWTLPDVIVYPTGGGSGVIGMWKAFRELRELGLVKSPLPRFVSVQEAGCTPLVDAMAETGKKTVPTIGEKQSRMTAVTSSPTGMRVPLPPDLNLLVNILREMNGTAVAVSAEEIRAAQKQLGFVGISASPEGAAAWAGTLRLSESGWIRPEEKVVVFNTAHALKYGSFPLLGTVPKAKDYMEWLAAHHPIH